MEGDTIRVHRDSVLVEVPEVAGFDRVDLGYYDGDAYAPSRVDLMSARLDARSFVPAGGKLAYADLAIAAPATGTDSSLNGPISNTTGSVMWPEDYGDAAKYLIWGSEAEVSRRINIVIVPDGYTHDEKATMEAHAAALVDQFRSKTPYREHSPFLNFTLVYAYSAQSGTDECDCSTVRDTAMNTRFPAGGYECGSMGNRCLYYGTANGGSNCDPNTSDVNIAAAELRAPAKDATIVMVNTERYGGCGGARAVYAAGNPWATEIAVHELGHSLAGLADEYGGYTSCGSASGINVSTNSSQGSWPEWTGDLGSPAEGGGYYDRCVFRPEASCDMRALGEPFCHVCQQRFALAFFGHPRISATAPIASASPAGAVAVQAGVSTTFSVGLRLAEGDNVVNTIAWRVQGPNDSTPRQVASATPSYTTSFSTAGTYTVSCDVTADQNFIKAAKTGANHDVNSWTVTVSGSSGDGGGGTSGGGGTDTSGGSTGTGTPQTCKKKLEACMRNDQCCSKHCDLRRSRCK